MFCSFPLFSILGLSSFSEHQNKSIKLLKNLKTTSLTSSQRSHLRFPISCRTFPFGILPAPQPPPTEALHGFGKRLSEEQFGLIVMKNRALGGVLTPRRPTQQQGSGGAPL